MSCWAISISILHCRAAMASIISHWSTEDLSYWTFVTWSMSLLSSGLKSSWRRHSSSSNRAKERAHILEGLLIAIDHLDKSSHWFCFRKCRRCETGWWENVSTQRNSGKAILDMRLQKPTGLERDKLREEYREVMELIHRLEEILASEEKQKIFWSMNFFGRQKEAYGDERKNQ